MVTDSFTNLDDITRATINFLDGTWDEFEIHIFIKGTNGIPCWLVCYDINKREIVIPWASIRTIIILERSEKVSN